MTSRKSIVAVGRLMADIAKDEPLQLGESVTIEGGREVFTVVGFELDLPTKWVAHCHCPMCRRAHGAGYVTWASVPTSQFRITKGAEQLGRYASSAEATRSFCRTCGSPMLFESNAWAGEVHIALACVQGEVDRAPQAHAFFSSKAPWTVVEDGLPRKG